MNKFELTVEQYMYIVRSELEKRLSDRCRIIIIKDILEHDERPYSIRISWNDWRFDVKLKAFKIYYNNKVPVEACVKEIIADARSEYSKQLLK